MNVPFMCLLVATAALTAAPVRAADETSLFDTKNPLSGWTFGNGPEFPGAKGGIVVDEAVEPQHRPAIRLDGDFTAGGNYVQIGRSLPAIDLDALSFWMKAPKGCTQTTLRIIDGTDQCHQINLRIEGHGNWQHIIFPVAAYFEKAGTSASVEQVVRYEGWGGARDGKWHNPAKALYFLCGRHEFGGEPKGSIWLAGMKVSATPPKVVVTKTVRLDEFLQEGEVDWSLNLGWEFPGAKGELKLTEEPGLPNGILLAGDFTGGGAYIATDHALDGLDLTAVRMQIRTPNTTGINVRYVDSSDQCHQGRGFRLQADNEWHDVVIPVADVIGGEHWGGANDGRWHGGAKLISLLVGAGNADDKKPVIHIRNITADAKAAVAVAGEPYSETFEKAAAPAIPSGWTVRNPQGGTVRTLASSQTAAAFEGRRFLRFERAEALENAPFEVQGDAFAAAPGPWSVTAAVRSDLHSPDNSFTVRLHIDALDAAGKLLERMTLVDQCKKANWKSLSRQVEFPANTARARFAFTVHKTHGSCDFDALTATPLEAKSAEKLVERILIDGRPTGADGRKVTSGHLFYPDQPLAFEFTVQTKRPLPAESRALSVAVTDYWGAEQFDAPFSVALARAGRADGLFAYRGTLTVPSGRLDVGKYFEVHAAIAPKGYADASEYSAFARLPEAAANKHDPRRIPFSIRNWDSRIREYFDLAHRIGHRNIGLWGESGWDYVERLGANWYTGSKASDVERNGWKNITPEQLYKDTYDFMLKHKDHRITCLMQGNEPNENPAKAAEKVEAYRQVYKASKAAAPNIPVIGTSVPALDCFFEHGYGDTCDVYDFHVYETYENVRQGVRRYKELGRKYGREKPIWCTELGLNSQGQTRFAVAQEVVKKITAFFAEGGENVSWFTIQYPDPQGKARGTGGDAHNTFDCQYNLFNPRLDAIMYYNMINGICVKKFESERQGADGVQMYRFRDEATGDTLLVLWKEGARADIAVSLAGATDVVLTRIDGSHQPLAQDAAGTVTLGVGEPVLVTYRQPKRAAAKLEPLAARIAVDPAQPLAILKGQTRPFIVTGPGLRAEELRAIVPPRWKAKFEQQGSDKVRCTVEAPSETSARTGRVSVQRLSRGAVMPSGEITLSLPIMSPVSVETAVLARDAEGLPGLRVSLRNNGVDAKSVRWTLELVDAWKIRGGTYVLNVPGSLSSYLKGENEGGATLAGGEEKTVEARIADFAPDTIYRVRTTVVDELGRRTVAERYAGGFASAVRATSKVSVDGRGDEPFWAKAMPERIGTDPAQTLRYGKDVPQWNGPQDLSATWKAAWDDENLYLLVDVTDDVYRRPLADGALWNMDGMQFLFDPARTSAEKNGKYDYSAGVGSKGPQAWCHLTAHSSVLEGAAPWKLAETLLDGGSRRYEVAIPWTSLAPFRPAPFADLGISMILNEDDGRGRIGYTGWFAGPHTKDLDHIGDLVLLP